MQTDRIQSLPYCLRSFSLMIVVDLILRRQQVGLHLYLPVSGFCGNLYGLKVIWRGERMPDRIVGFHRHRVDGDDNRLSTCRLPFDETMENDRQMPFELHDLKGIWIQ